MVSVHSLVEKIYEKQLGLEPDVFIETWTLTPFEALELCESMGELISPEDSMAHRFGMIERGIVKIMGVRLLVE